MKSAPGRGGRRAEALAEAHLTGHGFHVLHRNLRLGNLELDLVAQRGDLVVVVEVRSRGAGAFETPLGSVSIKKRRLLLRATERLWRERLVANADVGRLRIDVIGVTSGPTGDEVEWIQGAITADDAETP